MTFRTTFGTMTLWMALVGSSTLPAVSSEGAVAAENLRLVRVPAGGIQPQCIIDERGTLHLIYFAGAPAAGDLFYVKSSDGGQRFSRPLRVNHHSGSAVALGNIRGAHLALGKEGRAHVAWMGSASAQPKASGGEQPMLYTRMKTDGSGFEPERNVITERVGLDGGGSIAADAAGNVYVVWHAHGDGERDEASRQVWVAISRNEGATFESEIAANVEPTGVCPCCGLKAFADSSGRLHIVYRSAIDEVHRDTWLLTSSDHGQTFASHKLHPWKIGHCMMSSAALAEGPSGVVAAWETEEQIHFARLSGSESSETSPLAVPGQSPRRKHPTMAVNARGELLLAWTEQMAWKKGGSLAWQVFDRDGRPLPGQSGKLAGVPAWSLVSAFVTNDGAFGILY